MIDLGRAVLSVLKYIAIVDYTVEEDTCLTFLITITPTT